MSSDPSNNPSPSNSSEPSIRRETSVTPLATESTNRTTEQNSPRDSAETPQPTAGIQFVSTPVHHPLPRQSITSHPRATAPLIFVNQTIDTRYRPETDSRLRQGRPLAVRHTPRSSSSQPPRYPRNPYERPAYIPRAHSQPRFNPTTTSAAMSSSSSSPGNTSTAGSGSGSNPSYTLPYAPFPYPMPKPQGGGSSGK